MAHDLEFRRSAVDDLQKLVKHNPTLAVAIITDHVPALLRDPLVVGEKKKGDLAHLRAYGFHFHGVAYRIVYEVDELHHRVTVVALGVHDVAYRRAQHR